MDQAIIDQNAAALERMRALVKRLDEDQLAQELGDGWTVAAALAHIAFWDRRAAVLLDRWSRSEVTPSPVDLDAINDALLPQWRLIPPRAAANEALAAGEAANRAIADVSDTLLPRIQASTDFRFNRARHRTMHISEIERALGA